MIGHEKPQHFEAPGRKEMFLEWSTKELKNKIVTEAKYYFYFNIHWMRYIKRRRHSRSVYLDVNISFDERMTSSYLGIAIKCSFVIVCVHFTQRFSDAKSRSCSIKLGAKFLKLFQQGG